MFWKLLFVAVVPSLSVWAAKGAPAVPGGSPTFPIPGLFVAPKPPPPPNSEVPPVVVELAPKPDVGFDPKRPPPLEPPKGVEPDVPVPAPVELPPPKPPKPPVPVPVPAPAPVPAPELEPKRPPPEVPEPNVGLLPKALFAVEPNAEVPA